MTSHPSDGTESASARRFYKELVRLLPQGRRLQAAWYRDKRIAILEGEIERLRGTEAGNPG
jgi:hypothetical protein